MTSQKNTRRKTYVFLALMVLFNSVGDTMLSRGMKKVGEVHYTSLAGLGHTLVAVLRTPSIWIGIGSLLSFFVCYMLLLSWADFSFVMPATAANFAIVPVFGAFLLHERVSFTRWIGVAIICVGVLLVSRTPVSTTENP
jgi:drug/metabolite transporter (DMT)-like permease